MILNNTHVPHEFSVISDYCCQGNTIVLLVYCSPATGVS